MDTARLCSPSGKSRRACAHVIESTGRLCAQRRVQYTATSPPVLPPAPKFVPCQHPQRQPALTLPDLRPTLISVHMHDDLPPWQLCSMLACFAAATTLQGARCRSSERHLDRGCCGCGCSPRAGQPGGRPLLQCGPEGFVAPTFVAPGRSPTLTFISRAASPDQPWGRLSSRGELRWAPQPVSHASA